MIIIPLFRDVFDAFMEDIQITDTYLVTHFTCDTRVIVEACSDQPNIMLKINITPIAITTSYTAINIQPNTNSQNRISSLNRTGSILVISCTSKSKLR